MLLTGCHFIASLRYAAGTDAQHTRMCVKAYSRLQTLYACLRERAAHLS